VVEEVEVRVAAAARRRAVLPVHPAHLRQVKEEVLVLVPVVVVVLRGMLQILSPASNTARDGRRSIDD